MIVELGSGRRLVEGNKGFQFHSYGEKRISKESRWPGLYSSISYDQLVVPDNVQGETFRGQV